MPLRFVTIKGHPPAAPSLPPPPPPPPAPLTLVLDSRSSSPVMSGPLEAGPYTVVITGTVSAWNAALPEGHAEPDAQYPTPATGRRSTQVGLDAETLFAQPAGYTHPLGHWTSLEISTGRGFAHLEPVGGPYTTPRAGHAYTYHLVSTGAPFAFHWADGGSYADNYGSFHITITKG